MPGILPSRTDPYLSEAEILELADRLALRAAKGRIVHLTPATARLCQRGLVMLAARPEREELVALICGFSNCAQRSSGCYSCTGKANSIMRLYEEETAQAMLARTSILSKKMRTPPDR